jgi:hypothetical protein
MDPLVLKTREPVDEEMECWDDDGDLDFNDDNITFRSASIGTTTSNQAINRPSSSRSNHRESLSSRCSISESVGEEDRQVQLPAGDDDASSAIAAAIKAGIPISSNVPASALVGGTIKRLGGKKLKKVVTDDWGEDLEMPGLETGGLKIRNRETSDFPDALRQVSGGSTFSSPPKRDRESFEERFNHHTSRNVGKLDQFRDEEEDGNDFLADAVDVPTIKLGRSRLSPRKAIPSFSPPSASLSQAIAEDFEMDFELPDADEPLKLTARRDIPRTPAMGDDFEEWAEGSLGTRFGGTRRDGRSNRSSSMSGMSPSVASSLTADSEDEGLGGLVIPQGALNFGDVLKRRAESETPDPSNYSGDRQAAKRASAKEDFFSGIEIGDGDVFEAKSNTFNRNVKRKTTRAVSPPRRPAVTLTFTNKPANINTRIPRPLSGSTPGALESVTESAPASSRLPRSQSRLGGHSAQSSITSVNSTQSTPTTSTLHTPSTPSRRGLGNQPSITNLRTGAPTTTSAQLLRMKRSMPVLRAGQSSPVRPTSYGRPPSRTDSGRASIPMRPKTPSEQLRSESRLGRGKQTTPFLPVGAAQNISHHVASKSSRTFRRHDSNSSAASDQSYPFRPESRAGRASSPKRQGTASDNLAREAREAAKRTITRPTRRRNFGDGSELEVFDDLPTSATVESKFVKHPIGRGPPKSLRTKLSNLDKDRSETPQPSTPLYQNSPRKADFTPRFARDTNASRIAREQRIGSDRPGATPLVPVSTNWKAQVAAKTNSPKHKRKHSTQPSLIKPLGDAHNNPKCEFSLISLIPFQPLTQSAALKGMVYNPRLFRWEGNENSLAPFDVPVPMINSSSPIQPTPPRPALISNANGTKGVQVVGGMVFDPQRMCWLKMDGNDSQASGEEDDPFAGFEDLDDGGASVKGGPEADISGVEAGSGAGATGDWLVGEEFDVGPEFVRRQRVEEEKWRRKVETWTGKQREEVDEQGELKGGWRWGIRQLAS